MAETGIKINSLDADNLAVPIKAQVEVGNVTVDIADVEAPRSSATRCSVNANDPQGT